jgi:hypothetical protein
MWFKDANILICGIDVLGGVAKIGPSLGQGQTAGGSHLFLVWCLCFEMIYL